MSHAAKHVILLDYYSILKINSKESDKYVALSNLSVYHAWKNIKKSCKNNKFKTSDPTWNEGFELPDDSNIISDIQDYFEYRYILEKHGENTVNPSVRIYVNKMENRISFKIKNRYHIELLTPGARKLLLEALKVRQLKTKMVKMYLN